MYKDMTEILKDGRVGDFELTHLRLGKMIYMQCGMAYQAESLSD